MSDEITSNYLGNRKVREEARKKELMAQLDQLIAQQEAAAKAPAQAPAAAPKAPTTPAQVEKKLGMTDVLQDSASSVIYAGTDLIDSTGSMINDAVNVVTGNLFDYRFGKPNLSGALESAGLSRPQTTGGQIASELVQWALPFGATLKAANKVHKATTTAGKLGTAAAAGAAADVSAFTAEDGRLSDLLVQLSDKHPSLRNPITEFLSSKEGDTDADARMKNVLEGLGMGMAVDGIFQLFRATRAHFTSKNIDPVKAFDDAEVKMTKEVVDAPHAPATPAVDTPMQQRINKVTNVTDPSTAARWQKRLDVNAAIKDADARKANEAARRKRWADGADMTVEVVAKREPGYDPHLSTNAADVPVQTPSRPLTVAERNQETIRATMAAAEAGKTFPHKVFFDPKDGHIVLAKNAEHADQIDLDEVAQKMLEPGYIKDLAERVKDIEATSPHRPLTQGEKNDLIINKEMSKALDTIQELQEKTLGKQPSAPAKKEVPVEQKLETIKANNEEINKLVSNKDPHSIRAGDTIRYKNGAGEVVTAKVESTSITRAGDPVFYVPGNNGKQMKISKSQLQQQGGFITPSMLVHLASAQAGGIAGWMSAEDDATLADKLSMAGFGALAGLGIGRVGAEKLMSREASKALQPKVDAVNSLARPEVRGIAPLPTTAKKPPVITKQKVDELINIAKTGKTDDVLQAAKGIDFNFDHIDSGEEVKSMIDNFSKTFEREIDKAKHGTQTNFQLKELAEEIGAGQKSLKELYQDTDNLGARILAHRALLTASAEKVTSLAQLAKTGDADAILALRKHVALHASIQAQMKGVQTEVARALAQFRIQSTAIDLAVNERNALIEAMGGHAANADFAMKLAAISNPKRLAAVTRKGAMARTQDSLFEAWVNGLLSGPVTHAVNFVGNTLVAITGGVEKYSAAMIGKATKSADAHTMVEANAHVFGMMEGVRSALRITSEGLDALTTAAGQAAKGDFQAAGTTVRQNAGEFGNAWQAFASDMPVLDNLSAATKEGDLIAPAISSQNWIPTSGAASDAIDNMGIRKLLEYTVDTLGAIIRTPGRLLTTSDELFKTIHYRGELNAQAYRTAKMEGLHGEELAKRIAQLVEDPTPALSSQALQAARLGTFTSPLGQSGAHLQGFIHKTPGMRYVMPFVRTPVNIMKFVGVRTPGLNLLAESVRNEFKAGGARRDMMLAKTATGGAMYLAGYELTTNGFLTGGLEKDMSAERLGGIQPYSVKIGDTYYAYNRLDPFGMFLGLAADSTNLMGMVDEATGNDIAAAASLAISKNLVSKSYLSGVVDLLDTISSQSEEKWKRLATKYATTFIPMSALRNTVRREEDPVIREVWSMIDGIKNTIPGMSQDLPPDLNIFGEEVKYSGGLGPDWISPIRTSDATTDIAASEIARLNIDLREPPKRIGNVDLTAKQYYQLKKFLGEGFKPAILDLVQSPGYKDMPEDPTGSHYVDAKEMVIRRLFDAHRRAATQQLLASDPELMQKFMQDKTNAANVLGGLPISPIQ